MKGFKSRRYSFQASLGNKQKSKATGVKFALQRYSICLESKENVKVATDKTKEDLVKSEAFGGYKKSFFHNISIFEIDKDKYSM